MRFVSGVASGPFLCTPTMRRVTPSARGARSRDRRSRPWHLFKYHLTRLVLRFAVGVVLRVRIQGAEHLPRAPYVLAFSHPSWADPFLLVGCWPGPDRIYILGPREIDMARGWRNRLITWTERGVPFRPAGDDLLDTARRASAVLRDGHILAISGEGRLSDREGEVVPFVEGPAYFALRTQVPVVPVGIVGTRWLRWGRSAGFVIGPPVPVLAARASREAVTAYTAAIQAAVQALISGRSDGPVPGHRTQWFSELFNERPWVSDPPAAQDRSDAGPGPNL